MSPLMYTKEALSLLGSWPIRHSRGGGRMAGPSQSLEGRWGLASS